MATTTVSYDGDGAQVDFTITYAYTARSFIQVFVDAVLQVEGTDYDFFSDSVIRFQAGSIPPIGTNNVELRRATGSVPLVDWESGASLLDTDQDLADLQLLHIVEELENNALIGMGKAGANWDAEGVRITDVAAPIADTDAATKASIAGQVTAAETAETNAETAETNAETAETNADSSATDALASAVASAASAASVSSVFPVAGLTVGRILVVDGATSFGETRGRVPELLFDINIAGQGSIALSLATDYSRFLLEIINYLPNTDNTDLLMTISDDSESTYESTGYDRRFLELKGGLTNNSQDNQSSFKLNKQSLGASLGTDRENHSFELKLLPGDGVNPFQFYGSGIGRASDNNVVLVSIGGVMMSSVTAVRATHFKLAASTGTMGAGLLLLWGIR